MASETLRCRIFNILRDSSCEERKLLDLEVLYDNINEERLLNKARWMYLEAYPEILPYRALSEEESQLELNRYDDFVKLVMQENRSRLQLIADDTIKTIEEKQVNHREWWKKYWLEQARKNYVASDGS